jgi:hypothetical protein
MRLSIKANGYHGSLRGATARPLERKADCVGQKESLDLSLREAPTVNILKQS